MIGYFSLLQSNTMGSLTTGKPYGLKGYFVTLSKVSGDDWGLEAIRLLPTSYIRMASVLAPSSERFCCETFLVNTGFRICCSAWLL
ncbi:MAG: hypothetical protein L3J18_17375 [Candidatus Brocadia sp.]|nr:MAG: hypothetical protein L3J18_17375 [Candidatus Brocadia sp.]